MAASIRAKPGETILEGGCGAGAALLCLAARLPNIHGIGIEKDPDTAELASYNFLQNQHLPSAQNLSVIQAHIPHLPKSLRAIAPTPNGRFHHVMANPPWHSPHGALSPDHRRRLALSTYENDPKEWVKSLTQWVLPKGSLTFIVSTAITDQVCQALLENKCGSLEVYPFWPKQGKESKLVLIKAIYEGRGVFKLHAGLILHKENGSFTEAADQILRHGKALVF
ncbi:tRNA1(Val) (adenine(37)-N6)-methyltransferase [Swingsia samuiensis]|nr:SAM-dependent methyltransferase [Swingsia samuiensis]